MTQDEIRALSRRIPAVINATPEELDFWMQDAFDVLNNYCQQDFVYERQTTKRVRATTSTLVYLPKVLSGRVVVTDENGSAIFDSNDGPSSRVELYPGNFVLGYNDGNRVYRSPDARVLYVTGDWGFANTKEDLVISSLNALLAAYEAHRQDALVHNVADVNNAVTTPPATISPATSPQPYTAIIDLVNELKLDMNSHFGDLIVHSADDTNISTLPYATDLDTAIALINDLTTKFNTHLTKGGTATDPHLLVDESYSITSLTDYEYSIMPRVIRRVFLRLVQRIAIRDDAEDHRQINSPYSSESLGDNYSYDLGNGTLRNLMRPEEAHMLLPYINRGHITI